MENQQSRSVLAGRRVMNDKDIVARSEPVALDEILGFTHTKEKEKEVESREK